MFKAMLKKNKFKGFILPNLKTYYKTIVMKTVLYWHNDRNIEQWSRIKRAKYAHTFMTGMRKG
jgi:hypothetical protein